MDMDIDRREVKWEKLVEWSVKAKWDVAVNT